MGAVVRGALWSDSKVSAVGEKTRKAWGGPSWGVVAEGVHAGTRKKTEVGVESSCL